MNTLTLSDIQRAYEAGDPDLARLIIAAASVAGDDQPEGPLREGALTLRGLRRELDRRAARRTPIEAQIAWRRAQVARLEAPDADAPLPLRLQLSTLILDLWRDESPYARGQLLAVIEGVPLRWGPWRALKQIFKEAEAAEDWAIFGALTARFDVAFALRSVGRNTSPPMDVNRRTLGYLVRRAWRRLRRVAEGLPAAYADVACEVLRHYPDQLNAPQLWVANHILFHESKRYNSGRFTFWRTPTNLLKDRAYPDLWRRSPRPLLALLETAQAERSLQLAAAALRQDFRATLREVEPAWVARLIARQSATVHGFAVWLLDNVPKLSQAAYRELGLHEAALSLLDSPSAEACAWAAKYARTHARDLPLAALLRLANHGHEAVRKMARDLVQDRDPRKEVGLEGWGRLLGTPYGHDLATASLRKHFSARELTPAWFADRLASTHPKVVAFAVDLLPKIHKDKQLGVGFYLGLLQGAPPPNSAAVSFALDGLERFKLADVTEVDLRRLLVLPQTQHRARRWLEDERVSPKTLGADFFKSIADEALFPESPLRKAILAEGWTQTLDFDAGLADFALSLLKDVRKFSPEEIGFDWLMTLVVRVAPRDHDFAVDYMTKAFIPADFAEKDEAAAEAPSAEGEIKADLGGQSFLFTGKLATMTRSIAQGKVKAAKGTNASGVSATLDYLVIGDEGSSLYGLGRKGSKQVKAEKLIAGGAAVRIISETAFLQMVHGQSRSADSDAVAEGCARLWEMAFGPGEATAPLGLFARHYIRRHHKAICPDETDRYVDPGAEIPDAFLTFERLKGPLGDPRPELRELALLLCRYEFARLAPPMEEIVLLSELPYREVRAFITEALTAKEAASTKRFRLDPAVLTPEAVYRFCESLDASTRALGMHLISLHPRLSIPEELFRLTESPDRAMRAFVIAQLWTLYRDRGLTAGWRPDPPKLTEAEQRRVARKAKKGAAATEVEPQGLSARPSAPPAQGADLRDLLRRGLFGLSSGRLPSARKGQARLKPLADYKAKRALIEIVRDLAIEDAEFATLVIPLFSTFTRSLGANEAAACLVALTRLRRAHPDLPIWREEAA
ncbi:BRCT domain-containing protein [Myxococcota bacterium]|nr:BRCT domain-containing protein [Myxococcota bacterium]MBU1896709.1 BRCT domain-containing protein [Myxococcota bacterium]